MKENLFRFNLVTLNGVIYVSGGKLTDTDSFYMYNGAIYGGVFNVKDINATLKGLTITKNYGKYGGAFYAVDKSKISILDSVLLGNFAVIRGGTMMIQK